jgi:hypothetical protein
MMLRVKVRVKLAEEFYHLFKKYPTGRPNSQPKSGELWLIRLRR